jgi:hypothetical protein
MVLGRYKRLTLFEVSSCNFCVGEWRILWQYMCLRLCLLGLLLLATLTRIWFAFFFFTRKLLITVIFTVFVITLNIHSIRIIGEFNQVYAKVSSIATWIPLGKVIVLCVIFFSHSKQRALKNDLLSVWIDYKFEFSWISIDWWISNFKFDSFFSNENIIANITLLSNSNID